MRFVDPYQSLNNTTETRRPASELERVEMLDAILAGCKHANACHDAAATEGVSLRGFHSISGGIYTPCGKKLIVWHLV